MKKYFIIWLKYTLGAMQIAFASRIGAAIFLFGKVLRFFFYLFFIFILFSKTKLLGGYTLWQMIFFFMTYNLIDTIPQFLFRDVYRFRGQIVNGFFDHTLLKPISPLFKSLFGGSDMLDFFNLFLILFMLGVSLQHVGSLAFINILVYILLVFNSCIIALAFHIFVLSLGILTTEVDNAVWLYRDLTQMGRFPITIYAQPVRNILTFVIPIGIMMTFPAQALLGLLSPLFVVISLCVGIILLFISYKSWQYSLKFYGSASS